MRVITRRDYSMVVVVSIVIAAYFWSDIRNNLDTHSTQPVDLAQENPLVHFPNNSLELRNLTWLELRDRLRSGYTRVIVPTGGIEQNGPFVVLGKHDLIVEAVSLKLAADLGKTLVAPTISFVPQGNISPPSMHMRYPGTISLSENKFQGLLEDITMSLAAGGFQEIIILGDSGPSQHTMDKAAHLLDRTSHVKGARVISVPEFYNYNVIRQLLLERGIQEAPENFHEELAFSLQLLAIDPTALRLDERINAGHPMLGGVDLRDREKLTQVGQDIISRRVAEASAAIRAKLSK